MRVLLVEYFGRGGIAHYTHCLAQAVAHLGAETALCTCAPYEFRKLALPYTFHEVFSIYGRGTPERGRGLSKFAKGIGYLQGFGRIGRTAREIAPDLIHIQSSSLLPPAELGLLLWLSRRYPLVYTIHNLLPHEARSYHRTIFRAIYRIPQALIVHGEAIKTDLHDRFALQVPTYVIPHGEYSFLSHPERTLTRPAARKRLGVPPHSPLILFFGAIRHYKGLDTLLEALPKVLTAIPEVQTWVVGRPLGSFAPYQEQIVRLGLAENVKTVLEYVPQQDIPVYFAAADVVAAPYKETYQSGVIQLAYGASRPVVTTCTGALPEVVEDGQSGLLVPPGDRHALAQALIHLLRDPAEAARMGAYGQQLAQTRFSWSNVAKETLAVYQQALGLGAHPCSS